MVGSGIMVERLASGSTAVALFAIAMAAGAAPTARILGFGPISGAHFNPAVSLRDAWQAGLAWRDVPGYVAMRAVGAFAGVAAAQLLGAVAGTALGAWRLPRKAPQALEQCPARPAAFSSFQEQRIWSFRRAYREIENRIRICASVPFDSLDPLSLRRAWPRSARAPQSHGPRSPDTRRGLELLWRPG